jgi:large subunit ribosomal protein L24e
MVVKTDTCAWSETKIYPGHGRRFVTKGGLLVFIQNSKVRALYHQRKKSAKLGWTMVS